jgi:biotin carboxyl carrier protein
MLPPRDRHHTRERLASLHPCAGAGLWACAIIALSVGGCSRTPGRAAGNAAAAPPDSAGPASDFVLREDVRGVATAAVQAASVSDYVDVPARIAADPTRVVRVYAPLSGRLIAVHVRPSDAVQQGQVLAVLASSDVAVAQVKQQALERSKLLYENHVVALREYQQAQADARSAAAALESAVERLQLLTVDTAGSSDQVTVTAPRAGVIIDLGAAPGEYAKSLDNQNPLCVIADLRRGRLRKGPRQCLGRCGSGGDRERVPQRHPPGTRHRAGEHDRYHDPCTQDPRRARQPRPASQA